MKILFVVILILVILILIPIPIKISMFYSSDNYYFKIYKYEIISKSKIMSKDTKGNGKFDKLLAKFRKLSSDRTEKGNSVFTSKDFLVRLIRTYSKNTYKPILKFKGSFNYSLGDSAHTAIAYGLIETISSFIYKGLSIVLKIKKSNFNINPIFKDSLSFSFSFSSILFISLGKVIYMFILFLKTFLQFKEVTLFKGKL